MSYDSTRDTNDHIREVRGRLMQIINDLGTRAWLHDASKLMEPEKPIFDEFTPKLRGTTYSTDPGSDYQCYLREMGEGLAHHYSVSDHHPEHFENGIHDMDLVQVTEMLADWKAATLRHADGDLRRSIEENAERFGYGDEIKGLLMNTAERLGWLDA